MKKKGEKQKSNMFFYTKPARFARLPPDTYIGANMLTLTSLCSELLNDIYLETCEPIGATMLTIFTIVCIDLL